MYIGKYLEGGLVIRKHSWKGSRRVEADRRNKLAWLACTRNFAWHSSGATARRQRVGELASALGITELSGIKVRLGKRWAYRMRESITLASRNEWSEMLACLRRVPY